MHVFASQDRQNRSMSLQLDAAPETEPLHVVFDGNWGCLLDGNELFMEGGACGVSIYNADTSAATVRVSLLEGTVRYTIIKRTLAPGETLERTANGWLHHTIPEE